MSASVSVAHRNRRNIEDARVFMIISPFATADDQR